jgi:ribosomal protein L11 methylase PrmA
MSFVTEFAATIKPGMLWDIGCNTGEFSAAALKAGATLVIGLDADQGALEKAFARASDRDLNLLPLYMDLANPSPDQGWEQLERAGLQKRAKADAITALAVIHHMAISNNIPLARAVRWLVSLAPHGVIEFVPKSDPMVQKLLALREDIFADYSEQTFIDALQAHARIVKRQTVSAAGREMFWYARDQD